MAYGVKEAALGIQPASSVVVPAVLRYRRPTACRSGDTSAASRSAAGTKWVTHRYRDRGDWGDGKEDRIEGLTQLRLYERILALPVVVNWVNSLSVSLLCALSITGCSKEPPEMGAQPNGGAQQGVSKRDAKEHRRDGDMTISIKDYDCTVIYSTPESRCTPVRIRDGVPIVNGIVLNWAEIESAAGDQREKMLVSIARAFMRARGDDWGEPTNIMQDKYRRYLLLYKTPEVEMQLGGARGVFITEDGIIELKLAR
jgi:hypothetical protein